MMIGIGDLIIGDSKPQEQNNNVKMSELLLIQMFCFCLTLLYDLDCQKLQLW